MDVKNVQLTMTESQAQTIMNALDLYSRLGHGQVFEIKNAMERHFGKEWGKDVDDALKTVKAVYFPELRHDGEYYSIFNERTPEESKIGWDLIQVLRYAISWHKKPLGGHTVDFGPPIASSLKESLASVKINVDEN